MKGRMRELPCHCIPCTPAATDREQLPGSFGSQLDTVIKKSGVGWRSVMDSGINSDDANGRYNLQRQVVGGELLATNESQDERPISPC